MKKYHFIVQLFWIGLSLFVICTSYELGLEDKFGMEGVRNPGPGFMPFLLGILLLLITLSYLLSSLLQKSEQNESNDKKNGQISLRKLVMVLTLLFGYALLLERLGYVVTTFLVFPSLFIIMGCKNWILVIVSCALIALVSYFFFNYLGARFPTGFLKL